MGHEVLSLVQGNYDTQNTIIETKLLFKIDSVFKQSSCKPPKVARTNRGLFCMSMRDR